MRALRARGLEAGRPRKPRPTAGRSSASASACRCCSTGSDESPDVAGPRCRRGPGHPPARHGPAPADRLEHARGRGPGAALRRGLGPTRRGCTSCTRSRPNPPTTPSSRAWCDVRPPLRGRDRDRARCGRRSSTPRRAGDVGLRLLAELRRRPRPERPMDLYPAIDLRGGRVVHLQQGDYDARDDLRRRSRRGRAALRRGGRALDPRRRPRRRALGGDATNRRGDRGDLRERVARKVQTGGGVRDVDDAPKRCSRRASSASSSAPPRSSDPELVDELAATLPGSRRGRPRRAWPRRRDPRLDRRDRARPRRARAALRPRRASARSSSPRSSRDGMLGGPDLEQLASVARARSACR